MIPLDQIRHVAALAKDLLREREKAEKMSASLAKIDASERKRLSKGNVDLNAQAWHISRIESQLHAACVDAGLADLRTQDHYRSRIVKPYGGFHEFEFIPAKPRALASHEGSSYEIGSGGEIPKSNQAA